MTYNSITEQEQRSGIWTVDELTYEVKGLLEPALSRIWVEGEVTSCRPASSGHIYFNLRGQNASLPCALFRRSAQRLKRPPKDGDRITCYGNIEVYPPQGRYQLIVQQVQFSGEGELLAKLEALRRKLHGEGLFDADRKRPLPPMPRRVGVVTSPTGAAIRDIIRTVHSRFPAQILLAPAAVQGDHAPSQILSALESLIGVDDVDVIIIGRGGGSIQDLWAFNDEALVRAVAACPKPIISAVGHEIDTVLTDHAADRQTATPTAAGEAAVPDYDELSAYIDNMRPRLVWGLKRAARNAWEQLRATIRQLPDPTKLIHDRWQRLDIASERAVMATRHRLQRQRDRLESLKQRLELTHPSNRLKREQELLDGVMDRLIRATRSQLERFAAQLREKQVRVYALSPQSSLSRGYAIVRRTSDGRVVRTHRDVKPASTVEVLLADGTLEATVNAAKGTEEAE